MNPIVNQGIDYGVGTAARQLIGNRVPFLPDFYNSRAGTVQGGFSNSQFSHMIQGDGGAWRDYLLKGLGGVGGGMVAGPWGALAGSKFLPWIGNKIFGGPTMPQFSNYGPYAGAYRGLPGGALFGAGYNPGDVQAGPEMPQFFGDGPGYIQPDVDEPDNYVEQQSSGGVEPRFSGGSVTNFMVNGSPMIKGVSMGMGNYTLPGGMTDPNQRLVINRWRDL